MCQSTMIFRIKSRSVMAQIAIAALVLTNTARAHQDPPGCAGNISSSGINVVGPTGVKKAHVGEVARIQVLNFGVPSVGCSASNVVGRVLPATSVPGPTSIVFVTNAFFQGGTAITPFNPPLGDVINCPGPDPRCSTNGVVSGFYVYTIQPGDVTGEVTNAVTCPFPFNNPAGAHRVVYFFVTGNGVSHASGAGELTFSACNNDVLDILTPRISCTKSCTNGVGQNGAITFGGSVLNTGDATLFNVSVSNFVNGSLVLITNIATLNPGQAVGFNGSYVPNNPCAPTTDIIFVRGTDELGLTVSNQCSATCSNVITPCISVTKACTPAIVGASQTISGVVSNCGNITLTNIIITDNVIGAITNFTGSLAPGASFGYSATFTAVCGGNTNTVTARGTSICGVNVTNTATAVCPVTEAPCIVVSKACTPAIVGANQTISGVVSNCGNVPLTGVAVTDNILGAITNFPGTLAVGGSFSYSRTFTAVCGGNTNTVTARGTSPCGAGVTNTATAICPVTENPCIGVTKTCDTVVIGQANFVTAVVTNCGNVPLHGITVTDNLYGSVGTIALLAPGGTATLTKSVTNTCGTFTNIVTATGLSPCNTQVQAQSTATCAVTENPCIRVTKTCNTVTIGQANTVTAVVTNCGNVPLHGITVVDNLYGSFGTIALLAPGGTATLTKSVTNTCGNFPNTVTAIGLSPCNTAVTNTSTATCSVTCAPQIKVYKQVVCYAQSGCVAFSPNLDSQKIATAVRLNPPNDANCPAFCYRITVTNSGNVILSNLVVFDANSSDGKVLNLSGCGFPATLPPGGSASCIVTTNHCVNAVNIVTASGVGQDSSGAQVTVTATDTNRVVVNPISVACNVRVLLTNGAAAPQPPTCLLPGVPYIVRTIVMNTGQFDLQNVRVTSTGPDQLCNLPATIGNLAINERRTNDCTFVCDTLSSHTYSVSVTGEASQTTTNGVVCDHNIFGQQLVATNQNPCSASVCCAGRPKICVTKEVACFLGTNTSDCVSDRPYLPLEPGENCGPFGKTATGVKGDTQDPAFCYRISVTNCGTVTLTNVSVVDYDANGLVNFGDLTTNFVCLLDRTLAPNEGCEFVFKAQVGQNLTNTVEAVGYSIADGTRTNDVDNAVVHVLPARVTCVKQFRVDGGPLTDDYEFTDQDAHTVVWYVTIHNAGLVNLLNVHVSDTTSNLGCNFQTVVPVIPVGGSVTVALCTNASFVCTNRAELINSVLVWANQYSSTNTIECLCAYDIEGVRISVRTECEAHIRCTLPNACRVTGGGRQEAPEHTCPDDVRYVTHGGQVGAPVGERTCAIDTNLPNYFLGNPCIHGRWTHVRHVQGGLRGNFHARFFDTLDCACLDTNIGPGGVYGPGTVTGGVCNKDDHKVAGPQPRPAPANKIVFTGVGDWADPNGRRDSRATLFRVDIEDRSEPGGSHPGGQVSPADRYRIRIWVLTQAELNQLNGAGPDRYLINFRNAISACNGINVRDGVDIGNSCGPQGTRVFGQRPPDIDDGGELDRGNHQIHPMIKHCDPYDPTGPGLANP